MKKTVFLCLPLLASVAACGGGHSSSDGAAGVATVQNPPPVNVAAFDRGTSTDAQVAGFSFNCGANGCPTTATTNTAGNASTVTLTNDGNGNVTAAALNISEGGGSISHTFDLTTAFGRPEPGLFEEVEGPTGADSNQYTLIFAGSADPTHSLSYTTYGYWSVANADPAAPGSYGVFAAGTATPAANMPVTGTASYSGGVIGQLVTSIGGTDVLSGTMTANADFGARTVNGSMALNATGDNIPIAQNNTGFWNDVSFSAGIAANSSHFTGTASAPSTIGNANSAVATEAMNGTVAGGFYGSVTPVVQGATPTPAEIGGVFNMTGAAGSSAMGAFGGAHK